MIRVCASLQPHPTSTVHGSAAWLLPASHQAEGWQVKLLPQQAAVRRFLHDQISNAPRSPLCQQRVILTLANDNFGPFETDEMGNRAGPSCAHSGHNLCSLSSRMVRQVTSQFRWKSRRLFFDLTREYRACQ